MNWLQQILKWNRRPAMREFVTISPDLYTEVSNEVIIITLFLIIFIIVYLFVRYGFPWTPEDLEDEPALVLRTNFLSPTFEAESRVIEARAAIARNLAEIQRKNTEVTNVSPNMNPASTTGAISKNQEEGGDRVGHEHRSASRSPRKIGFPQKEKVRGDRDKHEHKRASRSPPSSVGHEHRSASRSPLKIGFPQKEKVRGDRDKHEHKRASHSPPTRRDAENKKATAADDNQNQGKSKIKWIDDRKALYRLVPLVGRYKSKTSELRAAQSAAARARHEAKEKKED